MRPSAKAERAIVIQALRADHRACWRRAEVESVLGDIAPRSIDRALASLARSGVLEREGERFWATEATRRLDELGLIAI
jgi:hypothetical protein